MMTATDIFRSDETFSTMSRDAGDTLGRWFAAVVGRTAVARPADRHSWGHYRSATTR